MSRDTATSDRVMAWIDQAMQITCERINQPNSNEEKHYYQGYRAALLDLTDKIVAEYYPEADPVKPSRTRKRREPVYNELGEWAGWRYVR